MSKQNESAHGAQPPAIVGRPRCSAADKAILDATLALIGEIGYDRLTIASVASRSHVGKATIYRRWSSKHSLVADAFAHLPPLELPDTGNLQKDIEGLLRSFVTLLTDSPLTLVLAALGKERLFDASLGDRLEPIFQARRNLCLSYWSVLCPGRSFPMG
ncbi:TetR/AcrR family transcriptional regulator [Denitratisoma sp. DHT3]|uniref:TetR/AcrR family transcriptional regulator n=1 Tax=Denitratisoma sp. DHT3 TaxID=1981880 RepID=UPI001644CDF7|nr:TetR/AcrR family transcriptional regulator [Denitratisoma sp. DHT3]